jgi:hypothetical protein
MTSKSNSTLAILHTKCHTTSRFLLPGSPKSTPNAADSLFLGGKEVLRGWESLTGWFWFATEKAQEQVSLIDGREAVKKQPQPNEKGAGDEA